MSNKNSINYLQFGDFNIPNLTIPPEEANIRLDKWGMLYKTYLLKHKKVLFTTLLTQGKLYQHCAEVEKQAQHMFNTLVEQMKESVGVTEQLKEENQIKWINQMNIIQTIVTEMVSDKIIYI